MAYTIENNYTGNGSTRLYSFTFPYLEDTDIKVTLNQVATTNFELANATQINFTAPAGGANSTQEASGAVKSSVAIRIYRDTNIDNLQGEFFAGSAIRAQDLNNDFNQTLYVAQETQDKVVAIWDDTEETLSSSESFIDSDNYIMTAAAIDDRIIAKQAAHALTNGRIWVGNGSNIGAAVAPSGDVTMANTGAFTIANNAVTGAKILNDAIDSNHYAADSIDTEHYGPQSIDETALGTGVVSNAKLAANAVTTPKITNATITGAKIASNTITGSNMVSNAVGAQQLADNAVDTAAIQDDAVTAAKIGDGAVVTAALADDGVTAAKMADNAVVTSVIAAGAVTTTRIANDAIGSGQIADNAIDSEHYTDGSIDTAHIGDGQVATAKIADDGVTSAKIADNAVVTSCINAQAVTTSRIANDAIGAGQIADDAIDSEHYTDGSIDTAHIADANVTLAKIENVSSTQVIVGNGSNRPAAVAMSGDVAIATNGATTIQANAVEIGMIGCEQTTISDSDAHIPTSGAVIDYVTAQIGPIGGLEVIANKDSFPETQPASGVVISVADAGGIVVNGSGTSTTPDTISSDATVTINNINSQFNSSTVTNGVSFMVTSTGSGQIYNFHKATLRTEDILAISTDIDDFANRYRVGANRTANNHASNDDGDLWFDTGSDKMYVYNGAPASGGEWQEVAAAGDFKLLTVKDHDQASGGSGPTFNGSNEEFDLFDGSSDASITNIGQLIVSLNGVIQKPNTGTFSGSAEGFYLNDTHGIKFCDPPASGSSLFVTQIGSAVSLNEPADDSVSAAKIQSAAVTHVKLAADCVDGDNIQDDVINSEHIAAGAVDLEHMSSQSVDEDNLHISNAGSNGQFLQKQSGNSGGLTWATVDLTTFTADVTFDNQSNAGRDIIWDESADALEFQDSTKATFGTGNDLQIYHDGTDSYVKEGTGDLVLQTTGDDIIIRSNDDIHIQCTSNNDYAIKCIGDGTVELYHNAELKLSTSATGVDIQDASATSVWTKFSNSAGIAGYVYGNGATEIGFLDGQQHWTVKSIKDGAVELYYDNTKKFETTSAGCKVSTGVLDFDDSVEARFGTGNDLKIYHDGASKVVSTSPATLYIGSDQLQITNAGITEAQAKFFADGACELNYNNVKKFETTATGISVPGTINTTGTGGNITTPFTFKDESSNAIANFTGDAAELYYNNEKRFFTESTGASVCGDGAVVHLILRDESDNIRARLYGGSNDEFGWLNIAANAWTYRVENDGDYQHYGSSLSDRDLKDNITTVTETALDKVIKLVPKTYNWKQTPDGLTPTHKTFTGFIAQEVKDHIPSLVTGTDGQKNMALDYNGLLAHAIKAIGELNEKVAALEAA